QSAEGLAGQLAESETAGSVEQNVIERVARAATDGAKPRVGEFPRRKRIGSAGALNIAFETEHPGAALEIVAGLRAADEARRLGRIVIDRAPIPTDIAAEIGSGPAVHIERLIDGVRLAVTQIGRLH